MTGPLELNEEVERTHLRAVAIRLPCEDFLYVFKGGLTAAGAPADRTTGNLAPLPLRGAGARPGHGPWQGAHTQEDRQTH